MTVRVRFDYVFRGTSALVEVTAFADDRAMAYGAADSVPEAIALCVADAVRRNATEVLEQVIAFQETASQDRHATTKAPS